ncbi:MAG: sulfite exporter TauE/SafE family protein [Phyllobacteriaceae bacterium]|nr:sulfite exporter TauE/SafE family protein [Phyllobacteriaceae bacterium]
MFLLPPGLEGLEAALLIAASYVTSAMTAAFGIGGGLMLLALMGPVVPVAALIPVHGVVQLGSNAGRAWHMRHHAEPPVLVPFLLGSLAGAGLGAMFVIQLPDTVLKLILGLFVLAVTWLKLPALAFASHSVMAAGGLASTFATMFVGATGPLVNALFARSFDGREQLVANAALAMSIQHGLKVAAFGALGFAFWQWMPVIAAMIATGYLGTCTGARILSIIPETAFRRVFKLALTLLALDLIRRALL